MGEKSPLNGLKLRSELISRPDAAHMQPALLIVFGQSCVLKCLCVINQRVAVPVMWNRSKPEQPTGSRGTVSGWPGWVEHKVMKSIWSHTDVRWEVNHWTQTASVLVTEKKATNWQKQSRFYLMLICTAEALGFIPSEEDSVNKYQVFYGGPEVVVWVLVWGGLIVWRFGYWLWWRSVCLCVIRFGWGSCVVSCLVDFSRVRAVVSSLDSKEWLFLQLPCWF